MEKVTQQLSDLLQNLSYNAKNEEDHLMNDGMTLNTYQELSARTANTHDNEKINYALGLSGEAGEVSDLIKKQEFHGHEITEKLVRKELGDVLWYVSQLARVHGLTLEEIAQGNVEKLKARYPEGFSKEASVNRSEVEG